MDIKDLKAAIFDIDMQIQMLQAKRVQLMQQLGAMMQQEAEDKKEKPEPKAKK